MNQKGGEGGKSENGGRGQRQDVTCYKKANTV